MADRHNWRSSIAFKANYYKNNPAHLFVDSSSVQAKAINEITGLPVLGLDTNQMFDIKK